MVGSHLTGERDLALLHAAFIWPFRVQSCTVISQWSVISQDLHMGGVAPLCTPRDLSPVSCHASVWALSSQD